MANSFLTGLVLGDIIQRAKNDSVAGGEQKQKLDAQRIQQEANDLVLCLQYVGKLDEAIRNQLPDTFVKYRYATGWHTWYLDEATTASACVTQGSAKAKYYLKPQNQAFALTLDNPEALAKKMAAHITSGTKLPSLS